MRTFLVVVGDDFLGYNYANHLQDYYYGDRVIVYSQLKNENSAILFEFRDLDEIFDIYKPNIVIAFVPINLKLFCDKYDIEKYIHITRGISEADITIRISGCYGSGQINGFIGESILSVIKEQIIHISDDENFYDWLHVSDCCRAIDMIHNFGVGGIYDVCSEQKFSYIDVAKRILKQFQLPTSMIEYDRESSVFFNFNNELVRQLGWRQLIDFDDGLKDTITWYKRKYKF
jgi:hypothetical protein